MAKIGAEHVEPVWGGDLTSLPDSTTMVRNEQKDDGEVQSQTVREHVNSATMQQRLVSLYSLMQSFESKLGGGEGIEGLYGSITQTGMQKVLDCFKHNTSLDHNSVFIDIGAGLGRPLLHAMVASGLSQAWGVELDRVKCDKATAFCRHVLDGLAARGMMEARMPAPPVRCSAVEQVETLDPATHAYSFWEGVPLPGKQAFGALFARSKTLKAVAVVQRSMRGQDPCAVMHGLGFGRLLLLASFPVKMSGSGRSFMAYVFSKLAPAAEAFLERRVARAPVLPARAAGQKQAVPADSDKARQADQRRAPDGKDYGLGLQEECGSGDAVRACDQQQQQDTGSGGSSPRTRKPEPGVLAGSASPSKKACTPPKAQQQPVAPQGNGEPATAPRPHSQRQPKLPVPKRLSAMPEFMQVVHGPSQATMGAKPAARAGDATAGTLAAKQAAHGAQQQQHEQPLEAPAADLRRSSRCAAQTAKTR